MTRILALLPLLALTACGNSDNTTVDAEGNTITPIVVADAVCRPTPTGRQVTACYLNLVAASDDRLVSVDSPAAALAQIHETSMEGGMGMMRPIEDGVPLTAGEPVSFSPGANHIMLSGVREPLATGDTVELTLTFEHAPKLVVAATVGQPTEANAGVPAA